MRLMSGWCQLGVGAVAERLRRRPDRRQAHLAKLRVAGQGPADLVLLETHLVGVGQGHERAALALQQPGAGRRHPLRAFVQQAHQLAGDASLSFVFRRDDGPLAGQGAAHQHVLALVPACSQTLVVKRLDGEFELFCRRSPFARRGWSFWSGHGIFPGRIGLGVKCAGTIDVPPPPVNGSA
jgi:hypothetical protein